MALWMLMEPTPDRFSNRLDSILDPFGVPKCWARSPKIVTGRSPCCYFWDPEYYPHWKPFPKPLRTSLEAIWNEFCDHFGSRNRSLKHHGWHSKLYICEVEFWSKSYFVLNGFWVRGRFELKQKLIKNAFRNRYGIINAHGTPSGSIFKPSGSHFETICGPKMAMSNPKKCDRKGSWI